MLYYFIIILVLLFLIIFNNYGKKYVLSFFYYFFQPKLIYLTPIKFNNNIIIANHNSFIDFILIFSNFTDTKFLYKKELDYIPIISHYLSLDNHIGVNRDYKKDIHKLINNKHSKIALFPEGTRSNPTKIKQSKDFIIKNNLPFLKNLLYPRPKGLFYLLQNPNIKSLIDITILYSKNFNTLFNLYPKSYLIIKEIPKHNIPIHNYQKFKNYLFHLWIKKDKIISHFNIPFHSNFIFYFLFNFIIIRLILFFLNP